MNSLIKDIRYSLKDLVKHRGFATIAVITLALGIGANTAIFTVVNSVLLRPAPFRDPDRLVLIRESLPKLGWLNLATAPAEFLDYQQGNTVFSDIACFVDDSFNLTGAGAPLRVQAERVSPSLFPLLGVSPLRGRTFSTNEDEVGNNNVVILSYGLWQRQFGSDPDILGKTIKLDDKPLSVIGVMPPRFEFPYAHSSFAKVAELWIPLAFTEQEKQLRATDFQYGSIGRLKPGITIGQAQADIASVAMRFVKAHPEAYGDLQLTTSVVGLHQYAIQNISAYLLILFGAVGLLLLIACANVANLLMARAISRRREIAIRQTLGAGGGRIIRQLLTESILLAILGGGAGLMLAIWMIALLVEYGSRDIPRLQDVSLDGRVLGFTVLVSAVTGVLCGLSPAVQSLSLDLNQILKESGGRTGTGRDGKRLRNLLVILETASAAVLLVGAGLLINSFAHLLRVPPGFNPDGVIVAQTSLPELRYPSTAKRKAIQKQILERLAALPGTEAAGVTSNLPLVGERGIGFTIEGDPTQQVNTGYNAWVSNDYFRALGIPITSGRGFTDQDREGGLPVVVINEKMERRFWPNGDAIGKRIMWGGWAGAQLTIVGVVADVKVSTLEAETTPAIYMPLFQIPRARDTVFYLIRSSADSAAVTAALRREIKAIDAELPVYEVHTMNEVIADSVSQRRFLMLLLVVFAATAMLLAAIGLYGVMSFAVTRRTHEIGMRIALGARAADVRRMIIRDGMRLTLVGLGIGLIGAFGVTRFMSSLLFVVQPTDLLTFGLVSLALIVIALMASYIPSRRATTVDPLVALRYE